MASGTQLEVSLSHQLMGDHILSVNPCLIVPTSSRLPKNTVKKIIFTDFLKVYFREGFKKSAEFSALFKTHPPHSQSAEKNKKKHGLKIIFKQKISILAKNYFFPLKKSKILRKISRSGRSSSHLDLRNILSVRPPRMKKQVAFK